MPEISGNPVKAVFFDLGKVILDFNHDELVDRLLRHARFPELKAGTLHDFLFNRENGLCNLYDEGRISSRDFYLEVDRVFDLGVSYEGFVPLWNDIFRENGDVSAIMAEVRKKRPVYLLSNVNELHWEYAKGRFPALRGMDGWVLSYEVKAKKPARGIYENAVDMAGTRPDEALFIDDLPENIDAARDFGMHGINFTGAAGLKKELQETGII